jgi:hypothetical protein
MTERPIMTKTCSVDGCEKPARQRGYCTMHYIRWYRNGTLELTKPPEFRDHSHGYLLEYAPDHPLTRESKNRVYAHRRVLYDTRGAGPFPCHWCAAMVTWDDLHVDHLDDNKKNNDPANLVPSCKVCNPQRGRQKAAARHRAMGVQITAFGRTMCRSEWAREVGISVSALAARIASGWPLEKALTEPRGKTGPKR